jgi:hypothetical protein
MGLFDDDNIFFLDKGSKFFFRLIRKKIEFTVDPRSIGLVLAGPIASFISAASSSPGSDIFCHLLKK